MKLDFLHSDHSTTLWSRLKSTYFLFFRRFRRFFVYISIICLIDAKKESRRKTVYFFGLCSNFLAKSDKGMKFGKSVRLGLKFMKKGFGRNFCHSRASGDPLK